jgi:hypothetical protein
VNPRTSFAFVVLAALLGLAVWWFELRGEGEPEQAKLLLRFEPEEVRWLELPLEGGGRARAARGEGEAGGWRLEQPLAFPADEGVIESALKNLSELEHKQEIPEPAVDASAFGFDEAAGPVRLQVGEVGALEIEVGSATPLGSETYVRRDGRLYTVEQWRTQNLRPTLLQLRDKRISRLETDQVDGLEILEDGHPFLSAERRGDGGGEGEWWLLEPQLERADEDQIRRTLSDLTLSRASAFVDEPQEPATYGLDAPRYEVRLRAGDRREVIALGRGSEHAYASVEGRDVVYEIPERVLDALPREPFAFRDKQVLKVDDSQVERIALDFPRDGKRYAFARGEGRFASEDPTVEVDSDKLEDLLFTLSELSAARIIDQTQDPVALGLEPPRVRVSFEDAQAKSLGWLELGDPTPDEGLPARSSRGDRIWRVSNDLGREVPLGEEAFRNNFAKREPEEAEPTPPPPAEAVPSEPGPASD